MHLIRRTPLMPTYITVMIASIYEALCWIGKLKNGISLIYIKPTLYYPRRFAIIHCPIFAFIKICVFRE
jgi:hypothetical protein